MIIWFKIFFCFDKTRLSAFIDVETIDSNINEIGGNEITYNNDWKQWNH